MVIVKKPTPPKCKLADGINIVSHIESEAGAGQIFIPSDVFSVTFGKLNYDYKDIGNRDLKNVDRPIRLYEVLWDPMRASDSKRTRFIRRSAALGDAVADFGFHIFAHGKGILMRDDKD